MTRVACSHRIISDRRKQFDEDELSISCKVLLSDEKMLLTSSLDAMVSARWLIILRMLTDASLFVHSETRCGMNCGASVRYLPGKLDVSRYHVMSKAPFAFDASGMAFERIAIATRSCDRDNVSRHTEKTRGGQEKDSYQVKLGRVRALEGLASTPCAEPA